MPSLKAQSLLQNATVVVTAGDRPQASRSVLKKIAATALVLAGSIGVAQAQSFDPVSQYGDNALTQAAAQNEQSAQYETQRITPSFAQRQQMREQARSTQVQSQAPMLVGRVVSVEKIKQGRSAKQNVGTIAGSLIGGLVGHQFGGGDGKKVMTAVGAITGGSLGNRIAKRNEQESSRVGGYNNVRQVEDNVVVLVSVNQGSDYRTYEIVQSAGIPVRRNSDVYLSTANDGRSLVALPINPENNHSYRNNRRP